MDELIGIAVLVGLIFLLRAIGAWMFRINEVIKNQAEILTELKKLTASK